MSLDRFSGKFVHDDIPHTWRLQGLWKRNRDKPQTQTLFLFDKQRVDTPSTPTPDAALSLASPTCVRKNTTLLDLWLKLTALDTTKEISKTSRLPHLPLRAVL